MADYGSHPTSYGHLSNDALLSMYRGEQWSKLGEFSRRELLQETVNRSAKAHGELGSCRVEFADLGSATAGVQSGNVIQLDRERFVNDRALREYNGRTLSMPLADANLQALETVLHEDIHAWQNQCIDGTISCGNPQLLSQYLANNFDVSIVQKADGSFDLGQQYLKGETENGGYYLYYFQSTERDAHRLSELWTQQIAAYLEQKHGADPSLAAYRQGVEINGYQATLKAAKTFFGTEYIEQDINTTLQNQYYQTGNPVSSPVVAEAVKQEMILSLQESLSNSPSATLAESGGAENARGSGAVQSAPNPGVSAAPEPGGADLEMEV